MVDARPWEVVTSWGDRTLSAEVLGSGARHHLSLGNTRDDDVQLGHPAHLAFELQPDGLAVEFTQGVTGALKQGGDWPRALTELVSRGVVKEHGERWQLSLAKGDELALRVGTLTVEVREAKVAPSRLPIEAAGPAVLLLAIGAVVLVVSSIVAPAPPFPTGARTPSTSCGTGIDPACTMTRDGQLPMDEATFHSIMANLRIAAPEVRPRLAESFLVSHNVTARQLQQVLTLFADEPTKLKVARMAAPHLVDPGRAFGFAEAWADRELAREYGDVIAEQLVRR